MDSDEDKSEQEVQKKHQQLLYRISYMDDPEAGQPRKYNYSADTLQPFLYFYKLLALRPCDKAHRNQLVLNIPDTVVFNDGDNPTMWFYTNDRGEVVRMDNPPYYQITNKFGEGALDKELVCVLKKPTYGYGGPAGNEIKVVSASEVKTVLSLIFGNRNEISVIQRFVKSGSVKPSIVRTCWRSSGHNESWTINSNYEYTSKAKVPEVSKFIVNTKFSKGFRAIKNVSQKYTNQTLKYVKNIVDFVSRNLKIRFKEFVCDFIKDEAGNWWFINVKAFILEAAGEKINIKPITMHDDDMASSDKPKKNLQTYTKCKKCKYCYKVLAQHLMTHKLTLMMILQCDQHLIRMGQTCAWLDRSYKQHVSTVNLYVEHKVCDSCYKLYSEVQKVVELEEKMARLTGASFKGDNKNVVSITSVPAFKGESPQFGSRFQKIKYDKEMPENWGLPPDSQIAVGLENQASKAITRCKFMVFIHGIRDIPKHFLTSTKKYSLRYSFMEQTVAYSLDLQQSEYFEDMLRIKLNKIKLLYFFIESRDNIKNFIKKEPKLRVQLLEEDETMGFLQLELDDFKSDKVIKKDYFKMFSGAKVFPYLSWGLFASLGLYEGSRIESNSVKMLRKNDLLLPEVGYHCPDLLPQEWIEMICQKPDVGQETHEFPSDLQDELSLKSNSELFTKEKIEEQLQDYTKRRKAISHTAKRKVFY